VSLQAQQSYAEMLPMRQFKPLPGVNVLVKAHLQELSQILMEIIRYKAAEGAVLD